MGFPVKKKTVINLGPGRWRPVESPADLLFAMKKARKIRGITQKDLSAFADLSPTSVHEIESGQVDPRLSHILAMLQLCGVKLQVSVDGVDGD